MNIHEHQAKELLNQYGVPTPTGVVILDKSEIDSVIDNFDSEIYVVKAQIHAGGRGKAGGVKVVKSKEEAKKAALEMWNKCLITPQTGAQGQIVRRIYVESGSDIDHEYYFSILVDRALGSITMIASKEGGVNIEEVAEETPDKITTVCIDTAISLQPFHCRAITNALGLSKAQAKQMNSFIKSIYNAFLLTDASQIEINPLVSTRSGDIIALDAKMNFDDNALFRQKNILALRDETEEDPLEVRATNSNLSYVRMEGNIGCMVNGAGLAMATMDIIKLYGAKPANFLDVGGDADKERVTEAFNIILADKSVKGILVNIFGGIMRCNIIAEGIVAAAKTIGITVPLVVRLEGTNVELGKEILKKSGLKIIPADNLADAAQKIVDAV